MRGKTWQITFWSKDITDDDQDKHIPLPDNLTEARIKFRCFDDDNILYCEGTAVDEDAAEQAYDFMRDNYGCTSIKLLNLNKSMSEWELFIG